MTERFKTIDQAFNIPSPKEKEDKVGNLLNLLAAELDKGVENLNVGEIEQLLSGIYRLQAEVIDPSPENLFILWKEFKYQNLEIFVRALAMITKKKIEELGLTVKVIVGMPNSASWMTPIFLEYFPKAQAPTCTKDQLDRDQDFVAIPSLTYTKRDDDGNRLPVDIYLEEFSLFSGIVLVLEDVLATGETSKLVFSSLEKYFGVSTEKIFYVAPVSMDMQRGSEVLGGEMLIEAYTPIRVTNIGDENEIKTYV